MLYVVISTASAPVTVVYVTSFVPVESVSLAISPLQSSSAHPALVLVLTFRIAVPATIASISICDVIAHVPIAPVVSIPICASAMPAATVQSVIEYHPT